MKYIDELYAQNGLQLDLWFLLLTNITVLKNIGFALNHIKL